MIQKRLLMTFKTEEGKKVSISIEEPKEDITEAEIKALMDLIVAKNIFTVGGGYDLVESVEAKIVVTNTTEFDLVVA